MPELNKCKMGVLETERLRLRQYSPADFEMLYYLLNDTDIIKYLFNGNIFTQLDTLKLIEETFCGYKNDIGCLILEKKDHTILGFSGIQKCISFLTDDYELGFVIKKEFWGNGYATEIGKGLIDYARTNMDIPRITATVHPLNSQSTKVLNKLNMKQLFKDNIKNRGDRVVYGLTLKR